MRNCTNTRLLRKMLIVLLLCSFIAGTFTACSDKKQSDGKTTFTVGFDARALYLCTGDLRRLCGVLMRNFHLMDTKMRVENMLDLTYL